MTGPTTSRAADTQAPELLLEYHGDSAVLVLNRPQSRNSLSEAMLTALSDALTEIAADKAVRAVVIAANGPAFCAGHDLKELTSRRSDPDGGRAYFRYMMSPCSKAMLQIVNLPRPVIAAVQGVASAAGCQLVASCDLAIASTAAKFTTPGVDIGLFCSTPMVALARNIARKIAGKSSHIVKIGKEGFYKQAEMSLADAYRYVSEVMVENLMARDAEEGLNAFIGKREPKWEDR